MQSKTFADCRRGIRRTPFLVIPCGAIFYNINKNITAI